MPPRLLSPRFLKARALQGLQGQTSCAADFPRVAPFHTTTSRRNIELWEEASRPDVVKCKYHDKYYTLPALWLRDNCPQSRSPSSGNKSFATAEIPPDLRIKSVRKTSDGNWQFEWRNDIPRFAERGHVSVFTPQQLEELVSRPSAGRAGYLMQDVRRQLPREVAPPIFWDKRILLNRRLREIDYKDWMQRGDEFHRAVLELALTGLVFIQNVPQTKQAVVDMGLQFGALQETFYGRTWDVVSKPQAENVAYTSEYLGLHSDMLYLPQPPKLQFLHCLENDATGGESLFSDAWRAAYEFVHFRPADAHPLAWHSIGFHYDANGFSYYQYRPVLTFDSPRRALRGHPSEFAGRSSSPANLGDLTSVSWSPPFQMPFAAPDSPSADRAFRRWHASAAKFQALLEDERNMVRRRLRPGECVVFDNRRVLHGRTAFDPASGRRHLHGAYVAMEDWNSTFHRVPTHILDETRELPEPAPRSRTQLAEYLIARMGENAVGKNGKPTKPSSVS
ncbi:Clavaminate synthase-like protein [Sodiomyces alkalinus F11]|uniref:Clavaminate synthase-like protein n=1 Tax=Sodiomyces alkalinus (strain CBS 110278 / VKM F-3762 / F11) TaxID=1314773 RepID=A0A3N2PWX6_SODAK|nr:Clavaminate synthase-like protein [Sodiomyces alkalinus F11]ROT39021.1 Clavaminate synthase-like protein [Sodiomyces alkalinus F11]